MPRQGSGELACALLVALTLCGCGTTRQPRALDGQLEPGQLEPAQLESGQLESGQLKSELWVQTSAEYAAITRQVYAATLRHVRGELARRSTGAPVAVILDLDETVIDNGGYHGQLMLARAPHSPSAFRRWVCEHSTEADLVPGAAEFVAALEREGVTPVFLSNRSESFRDCTVDTLVALGVIADRTVVGKSPPRLLLREDDSRSKESRRELVRRHYDVLALIGDTLGDFSDEFDRGGASPRERRERVKADAGRFGNGWFILPNPVYGDWQRGLSEVELESYFE